MFISVVLITGSSDGGEIAERSTEIYNPLTKTSCSLPKLPESRGYHSQDGDLACGGGPKSSVTTTCDKWEPASGNWARSHTLKHRRNAHVTWAVASGVYLIGGGSIKSEKVKLDGSVEDGFDLKDYTR